MSEVIVAVAGTTMVTAVEGTEGILVYPSHACTVTYVDPLLNATPVIKVASTHGLENVAVVWKYKEGK